MRLMELENATLMTGKTEIFDCNKVWVVPVRILGSTKIRANSEPKNAWLELDQGDHTIMDAPSEITFEKLNSNEWLALCECYGTVVLKGLPSLNSCEEVIRVMTPVVWTDRGWGALENPSIRTSGSITTINLDTPSIYKLVRNCSTGEFADDDGYVTF